MKTAKALTVALMVMLVTLTGTGQVLAAGNMPDDTTITSWINAALVADPRIDASDIAVNTKDGIAFIDGQARNLAEQHYAVLEAKKIKGVRGVVNRVTVRAAHRHDVDIRQLIRHRIINNEAVVSQNIGVEVKKGVAILSGTVGSYVEKQEAAMLASQVRGVTAVNNQIRVTYQDKRPDAQIRKDVQARLKLDVYLAETPIYVSVKDGAVTLQGEVSSPYQADRAFSDTYVIPNVVDVRNKLTVGRDPAGDTENRPVPVSDQQSSRTIRDQLAMDLRIKQPWDIHAQVSSGHVTLEGRVATYHQRMLADQDVRNVVGVAWVSNRIRVKAVSRSDQAIRDDARFNIDTDDTLFGDIIKVFVRDGVVTLTGTVQSGFQKIQAEDDIGRIAGVKDIVDALDITPHPKTSDAELKRLIRARLETDWATWPVWDRIKVTVHDHTVTLSGQVATWQQRREAGRLAMLTRGALGIDNRLTVEGAAYDWDQWYGTHASAYVYDPYYNEDLYLDTNQPDTAPLE